MTYLGFSQVTLETGAGQSVGVLVEETGLVLTDLFINGNGFGADTLVVGTGSLGLVRANVHFDGFSDGRVFFNNSTGPGSFFELDFGTFSVGSLEHTFTNTTLVDIDFGPGDDQFEIYNSFGYDLNVTMGDGDDDVNVGRGDMVGAGDATIFGGAGEDRLYFDNSAGAAPLTLTADQGAGLPFVDLYNGAVRTVYDSFALLQVEAGPNGDTLRTVAVPSLTEARLYGMGGDDTINVDGHPTQNSLLFPPVRLSVGTGLDTVNINADGAGGARALMTTSQSMASLNVHTGGRLQLAATALPGDNVITTQALMIDGRVDLTNGGMIFDYVAPTNQEAIIAVLIGLAHNGGTWDGDGLGTSLGDSSRFGLGYAQATVAAPGGVFLDQPIDDTAIAIRYTRYGDTDLNGVVNFFDFLRLRAGYNNRGFWSSGDFDYDLDVDFFDFLKQRANYNESV